MAAMARRTINIPDSTESLVREIAEDGESFSAAVTRLVEIGAAAVQGSRIPRYVGAGDGPPDEIGLKAERYLDELFAADE